MARLTKADLVPGQRVERYYCSICSELFQDPVFAEGKCQCVFCRKCILQSLKARPECPLCQTKISPKMLNVHRWVANLLDDLEVVCPNRCKWTGTYEQRKSHLSVCPIELNDKERNEIERKMEANMERQIELKAHACQLHEERVQLLAHLAFMRTDSVARGDILQEIVNIAALVRPSELEAELTRCREDTSEYLQIDEVLVARLFFLMAKSEVLVGRLIREDVWAPQGTVPPTREEIKALICRLRARKIYLKSKSPRFFESALLAFNKANYPHEHFDPFPDLRVRVPLRLLGFLAGVAESDGTGQTWNASEDQNFVGLIEGAARKIRRGVDQDIGLSCLNRPTKNVHLPQQLFMALMDELENKRRRLPNRCILDPLNPVFESAWTGPIQMAHTYLTREEVVARTAARPPLEKLLHGMEADFQATDETCEKKQTVDKDAKKLAFLKAVMQGDMEEVRRLYEEDPRDCDMDLVKEIAQETVKETAKEGNLAILDHVLSKMQAAQLAEERASIDRA